MLFSETERTPPYTKEGLRRWADYCRMVADMFGDTADQFEIWNDIILDLIIALISQIVRIRLCQAVRGI